MPFVNLGLLNLTNMLYRFMYLTKDMTISIVESIWLISNNTSIFFWISSITFLNKDYDWKIRILSVSFTLLFSEDKIWVENVTILPLCDIWTKFYSIFCVRLCKSTESLTLKKYPRFSLYIKWIYSWDFPLTSLK